jgi:hypothetical protein
MNGRCGFKMQGVYAKIGSLELCSPAHMKGHPALSD